MPDTEHPDPENMHEEDADSDAGHDEGGGEKTANGAEEKVPEKLRQDVEITDAGPCKKHIKITVNREDIDTRIDEKISELVQEHDKPVVAGFRPGKAPRKLVERRYHKQVQDDVRGEVLMASLEQLAEDYDVAPLAPPDIKPDKIQIPKEGPLIYEFDVEVRPQFDLPNYKGLKLKRLVYEFTEADVDRELRRLLEPDGQLVPKGEKATVEIGDYIVADLVSRIGQQVLSEAKEVQIRVDPTLALRDGVAEKFGDQLKGAKAGDSRVVEITLSDTVSQPQLRGQKVQATFQILDIKTMRLPELTHEYLHRFGVHNEEQLKELLRVVLERKLDYQRNQHFREQILQTINEAAKWDLPQDLLQRQARRAFQRKIMEMRSSGMSDEEISGKVRLLERDVLRTTAMALKEHFVLQKIAEEEKIDVDQDDIDAEIERIADRSDESPRRVRAQLEREDMMEALAIELIERKTLDLILENAEYEDQPLKPGEAEKEVATVEAQLTTGELADPTAAPPPEELKEGQDEEKQDAK
ncbi:MAG TPA: trigger factor [Gemmataceae bacterium]|nr:trigger factor [Gemmataceae bacterium]